MPAPAVTTASTFVGSDEVVLWAGFHSDAELRSFAADLTASSLVLIDCRSVLCCVIAVWRRWTAVTLFCSIAISCAMIESVSRPEAMPVSVIAIGSSLELVVAGQDVQRLLGRDRLEHVAVEVADL